MLYAKNKTNYIMFNKGMYGGGIQKCMKSSCPRNSSIQSRPYCCGNCQQNNGHSDDCDNNNTCNICNIRYINFSYTSNNT